MPIRYSTEQFIDKAKQVHGDRYDYSLVKYINKKHNVRIVCKEHGVFEQRVSVHLKGGGCPKCAIKSKIKSIDRLTVEESPYIDKHNNIHCLCTYCGKYFTPTRTAIGGRIKALYDSSCSDNRLYCSNECKQLCPIFGKTKYPKGHKLATSREVQPQLRKMVLERDNWTCQKCGETKELHCHHYEGIEINPIESADVDNCIALCKDCHKESHQQDGCNMKREKCKNR